MKTFWTTPSIAYTYKPLKHTGHSIFPRPTLKCLRIKINKCFNENLIVTFLKKKKKNTTVDMFYVYYVH